MENVKWKEQNRALEAVIDLPWGAGTKEIIAGGGVQVHLSIFPTPLRHKFLVFLPLFFLTQPHSKSIWTLMFTFSMNVSQLYKIDHIIMSTMAKTFILIPTMAEMSNQESYGSWFSKLSSQTQMHCCS